MDHFPFSATQLSRRPPWWLGPGLPLAVAALLFFARLHCPLLEPEESRYAEIPRQMVAADQFLIPTLDGQPYLDKPPLLYWLVMAAYRLCGVQDWAARLVPGLAAWLTVAVVYGWGRKVGGPGTGFAGALVLALSGEFIYRGRMLTMNGLLGLWVTAGLAAGHIALLESRRRLGWWLAAGAACGLGILTKGPVALALVMLPLLVASWLDRRLDRPSIAGWAVFLGGAGIVAAPWFVAVAMQEPGFVEYFFWKHHVERFVTPFDHAKPFWFYLPGLVFGSLPWILVLPGLVRYALHQPGDDSRNVVGLIRFSAAAAALGLAFFSLSGCKRAVYLVPVLPPLSLALGCYLATRLAAASAGCTSIRRGWTLLATAIFAVLMAGVLFFLPSYARQFSMADALRGQETHELARRLPVYCYPRCWSSVGFYLDPPAVHVADPRHRAELWDELRRGRGGLLVVKTGRDCDELLRDLPPDLEFALRRRTTTVTVGTVVPATQAARRPGGGSARED